MPNIFISYRREDTAFAARQVFDRLTDHFGKTSVSLDVDRIPMGTDFRKVLARQLRECHVMLAMIGDRWLNARDDSGQRRLSDPHDFVRLEVETAFGRGIPVIPVLVGNATMPREAELPGTLHKLAYQNATVLRADQSLDGDLRRIITGIEKLSAVENQFGDRFLVTEALDWGGVGQVYKATDLRAEAAGVREAHVALKVIESDIQFRDFLMREARMGQRLAHPNVLTVFDFGRKGNLVYAAMEYVKGATLDRTIRNNPDGLGVKRAMPIIHGIATALAFVHEKNVFHGDLKSESVLLSASGVPKIMDFGMTGGRAADHMSVAPHSPEVRDTFALGCLAYELLTGRAPFPDPSMQHYALENRSVDKIDGLSARQWQAIDRALKVSFSPYTVQEFLEQITD